MTGVTMGAETGSPSEELEFTPVFSEACRFDRINDIIIYIVFKLWFQHSNLYSIQLLIYTVVLGYFYTKKKVELTPKY